MPITIHPSTKSNRENSVSKTGVIQRLPKRKAKSEKRKAKSEKRKAKSEKRKAKSEKRKAKSEKRKAKSEKRKAKHRNRDNQMNVEVLTDDALLKTTHMTVQSERETTAKVVRLFQEISRRKLFLKRGFPNLYEMATQHFGYCAGSAMRRINAMRLVSDLPAVQEKIESGDLKLSAASRLQSFFYAEAKENRAYSKAEKIELVETCLNKSVAEVQKELVKRNPEIEKKEVIRQTSDDRMRLSFSISTKLNDKLHHLKNLLSHSDPNISMEDLLERLVELGLEKYDPKRKAARADRHRAKAKTANPSSEGTSSKTKEGGKTSDADSRSAASEMPSEDGSLRAQNVTGSDQADADVVIDSTAQAATHGKSDSEFRWPPDKLSEISQPPLSEVNVPRSRYVKANDQHKFAKANDGHGCTFVDRETGRRCGASRFIEKDHIVPFAYGGSNEARNLRPMCAGHNKFRWDDR